MKKNRTMRIAAVMLVFALLTTCIISGSFAKYTTGGTAGKDEARVAIWGVTFTTDGEAFYKNYLKDTNTGTDETSGISVKAAVEAVAPGTKGTLAKFIMHGTPEVSFEVTYSATVTAIGWKDAENNAYCPLVFKIKGSDTAYTVDTIAAAIASTANKQVFNVGDTVDGTTTTFEVTWEWPFSTTSDNDIKDTYLGDHATDNKVEITLNATATQID